MAFTCPYCQHQGSPTTKKKVSSNGWILFCVLLIFCFPLCWLPLVLESFKEEERRCGSCGTKLGS
jgi:uncharacterized membrane protein